MKKRVLIFSSILIAVVILLFALFAIWSYINRSSVMIADPSPRCDLDIDLDCDDSDFQLITNRIGECINSGNFQEKADTDHDGCITLEDQKKLFPSKPKNYTVEISFCNNEPYYECKKRCKQISGKQCEPVTSKAQKLEKDVCYHYPAQQMVGDPCLYCVIDCK